MGPGDRPLAAEVAGGLAVAGGSFARVLRTEALRTRRLPRTAAPALAATSPRRNDLGAALRWFVRPSPSRQVRRSPSESHSHRAGMPRIVQGGPSTRKGTRRSFLTAPQKASSGPTLARGASTAPAGLTARARPEARPESARQTSANLGISDERPRLDGQCWLSRFNKELVIFERREWQRSTLEIMVSAEIIQAEMARADEILHSLAGETVDTLSVNSLSADDAPFLGQIVSKLSPMIGNLLERRIIQILDQKAEVSGHGMHWRRQDPGFPDAVLVGSDESNTNAGYEVKAWYALSTELTGRFRESQNLLRSRNIRLVLIAWCMSHLVYGVPQILDVLTVPGIEVAASRDAHYHNPPDYLIVEPGDTTARTRNLQQTNVSGYKLQDQSRLMEARQIVERHPGRLVQPPSPQAQSLVQELMASFPYRLDTNFAKIDRVDNPDIERFKRQILNMAIRGRSMAAWTRVLRDLNGDRSEQAEKVAAEVIQNVYDSL